MFKSQGKVQYFNDKVYKIWLLIDDDIGKYYRSFVNKKIGTPKYPSHISIYRGGPLQNMNKWGLYEGKEIAFEYSNVINNDSRYWWLEVRCEELEAIRTELGLEPVDAITKSPDGKSRWHITIGNSRNIIK